MNMKLQIQLEAIKLPRAEDKDLNVYALVFCTGIK